MEVSAWHTLSCKPSQAWPFCTVRVLSLPDPTAHGAAFLHGVGPPAWDPPPCMAPNFLHGPHHPALDPPPCIESTLLHGFRTPAQCGVLSFPDSPPYTASAPLQERGWPQGRGSVNTGLNQGLRTDQQLPGISALRDIYVHRGPTGFGFSGGSLLDESDPASEDSEERRGLFFSSVEVLKGSCGKHRFPSHPVPAGHTGKSPRIGNGRCGLLPGLTIEAGPASSWGPAGRRYRPQFQHREIQTPHEPVASTPTTQEGLPFLV